MTDDGLEPLGCSWATDSGNTCSEPRTHDVESGRPGSGYFYSGGHCAKATHQKQVIKDALTASRHDSVRVTPARKVQPIKVREQQLPLI